MDAIAAGLFVGLLAMAVVWLVLCQTLFGRLKMHDPEIFAAIGEPHIIMNNALRHFVPFGRLLYSSRYSPTDSTTRRLIGIMRWYLVVYVAGFATLFALFFWSIRAAA